MQKNIVIKIEPLKINITPYGFHKYAMDYLDTANKWSDDKHYSPVPYFLYCRTIELGLKSYLLAKGKKLDWIKQNIGHDLVKGLQNANKNSLNDIFETTFIVENEIKIANKFYKSKGFEYFFISNHLNGLKDLPTIEILREYANQLIQSIKPITDNTDVLKD